MKIFLIDAAGERGSYDRAGQKLGWTLNTNIKELIKKIILQLK